MIEAVNWVNVQKIWSHVKWQYESKACFFFREITRKSLYASRYSFYKPLRCLLNWNPAGNTFKELSLLIITLQTLNRTQTYIQRVRNVMKRLFIYLFMNIRICYIMLNDLIMKVVEKCYRPTAWKQKWQQWVFEWRVHWHSEKCTTNNALTFSLS